jgi:hypothetical protein
VAKRRALDDDDDDENDEDYDDEDESSSSSSNESLPDAQEYTSKDQKMRAEWDVLEQEYALASHARSSSGHLKKTVPRNQRTARTKKRKQLEEADEQAVTARLESGRSTQKRLRGSQRAFDRQVIEDSHIFPRIARKQPTNLDQADSDSALVDDGDNDDDDDDSDYEEYKTDGQDGDGDVEENEGDAMDDDDDDSALEEDLVDDDNAYLDDDIVDDGGNGRRAKAKKSDGSERKIKSKRRRAAPKNTKRHQLVRLRNFQSQRLARRHGDALAAHASGQPLEAIQLLKEVAKKAPSAPQVYSSLGMVYQDMLNECRAQRFGKASASVNTPERRTQLVSPGSVHQNVDSTDTITDKEKSVPDPALAEQLGLAKKAYGSYHVAAILYKKDFALWVRAADAGADVVDILKEVALLPYLAPKVVSYHREEWKRWQSEILRDLHAADMLKPPGIDVPCKLAAMHIELGNLSEALTILTDLKNRQDPSRPGRSEFQSSYKAWILYADLMLRVGHECMLWNQGIKVNDNFMFRRWLRKYSHVFDWQERRLQALSLALETAVGTKSATEFILWMRNRALANQPQDRREQAGSTVDDTDARIAQGDSERQLLHTKHTTEVEDFDKTTEDMELDVNSEAAKDRQAGRNELLKAQRVAVATLNNEYDGSENQPSTEQDDQMIVEFSDSMPISASCRQVCSIASELMKHLHGLELFEGAQLVGDAVSSYFRLRAAKHDEHRLAAQRKDEWQEKMLQPSFLFATYEEVSWGIILNALCFSFKSFVLTSSSSRRATTKKPMMGILVSFSLTTKTSIAKRAHRCSIHYERASCLQSSESCMDLH